MAENLREAWAEYVVSRPRPQGKFSYEEFLNWVDEDTWAEWVDREVIVLSPESRSDREASVRHESMLRLREKLIAAEEGRLNGKSGYSIEDVSNMMKAAVRVGLDGLRR